MMHKFESAVGLAVSIAIDAVSKLATTLPILSEIESDFTSEGFHRVLVILRGASKRRPGNRLVRGLFTVYVYVLVESAGYPVLARLRFFEPDWTETRCFWQYDFQVSQAFDANEEIISVEGIDNLHIVPLAEINWHELPNNLRYQVASWL